MVSGKHVSKQKGTLCKGPEVKARLRDRKEARVATCGECSKKRVEK